MPERPVSEEVSSSAESADSPLLDWVLWTWIGIRPFGQGLDPKLLTVDLKAEAGLIGAQIGLLWNGPKSDLSDPDLKLTRSDLDLNHSFLDLDHLNLDLGHLNLGLINVDLDHLNVDLDPPNLDLDHLNLDPCPSGSLEHVARNARRASFLCAVKFDQGRRGFFS